MKDQEQYDGVLKFKTCFTFHIVCYVSAPDSTNKSLTKPGKLSPEMLSAGWGYQVTNSRSCPRLVIECDFSLLSIQCPQHSGIRLPAGANYTKL